MGKRKVANDFVTQKCTQDRLYSEGARESLKSFQKLICNGKEQEKEEDIKLDHFAVH